LHQKALFDFNPHDEVLELGHEEDMGELGEEDAGILSMRQMLG